MKSWMLLFLLVALVAFGCSPAEKADDLAALGGKTKQADPNAQMAAKLAELGECCDENSRAMGAECCLELDRMMQGHAGDQTGDAPQMQFKGGRPIDVPPEIAARWPKVRLQAGPKDAGHELIVDVGAKATIPETPLEVEVVAFVPAFKMSAGAITSDGAAPRNPAAKVVVREAGRDDWSGWLFANMPQVHAFEHDKYAVILLGGVTAEKEK